MQCRIPLLGDPNGIVFDWPGSTCPGNSVPAGPQPSIQVGPIPVPQPHQIGGAQAGQAAIIAAPGQPSTGTIGGALENPLGTIGQGFQNVVNFNPNINIPGLEGLQAFAGIAKTLSDPTFWKEAGLIVAGGMVVFLGVILFAFGGRGQQPAKLVGA